MMSHNHETNDDSIKKCSLDPKAFDKILLEPYNHIAKPRLGTTATLANAYNHWLNIPSEKCKAIIEVCRMAVNAILIFDDIEDNSKQRQGIPTAHEVFGIASTINAGISAYFLTLKNLLVLGQEKAASILAEQVIICNRGQGAEIYWRDNLICPTEEEYLTMIEWKTQSICELILQLMQIFTQDQRDFSKINRLLTFFMQIGNDYENLKSKKYMENKGYCDDLTEGKFSFPVIHAINNYPDDHRVFNILKQKTTDVEKKKCAVQVMEELGSFEYTRKVLSKFENEIREEIKLFGGNPPLEDFLNELHERFI